MAIRRPKVRRKPPRRGIYHNKLRRCKLFHVERFVGWTLLLGRPMEIFRASVKNVLCLTRKQKLFHVEHFRRPERKSINLSRNPEGAVVSRGSSLRCPGFNSPNVLNVPRGTFSCATGEGMVTVAC